MRTRIALALVAVLAIVLVGTPTADAKTRTYAVITFKKNYHDVYHSTLVWQVFRVSHGKRTQVERKQWRAASGFHRHATDSCQKNVGWLPNGTYHPRLYANYGGSLIKGRAIYLGAKACHNGTVRTALFIHTEQGPGSVQCKNRKGDQACRWEYPQINDYRSHGCVKLAPGDLKQLYRAWRHFTSAWSTSRVTVSVH
jgi:hypothetical protein